MEVKEVHYIDVKKKRIHFSPRIYFVIGQKQSKMFHNCNVQCVVPCFYYARLILQCIKGIVPTKMKIVIIYSPSFLSKPEWLSFIFESQIKLFYFKLERFLSFH